MFGAKPKSTPTTWDVERSKFSNDFVCKDFKDKKFPSAEAAVSFLKSKLLDNDVVEVIDLHEKRISTYKRKFGNPFEVCHYYQGKQLEEQKQIV
jgi:hypothetical protein